MILLLILNYHNITLAFHLVGDPPNIIIGSSFSEYLGFLDFIINIMPCIILVAVPVSLALMVWIYKPYLSLKKMTELDADKLKTTYPGNVT
jgi:Na+/H+ antiporter NhaD/arsenite permease-like protein